MADANDSVLDKAERVARRILERLGSTVDTKLGARTETLSSRMIGELTSQIEQSIESNLLEDERGGRRVAPNRFKVLFTYEETSALSEQYIQAISKELTASVFEYINNRRYTTRGSVKVDASRDLFAKDTVVKVTFENDSAQASLSKLPESDVKTLSFSIDGGQSYSVELKVDAAPSYIGRAAGNAIRIDDPSISRLHCSISLRRSGDVVIADVGSANGTFVNEQRLGREEARPLNRDDVVRVGDITLTVSQIR